jgi:hypothetical protein
VGVVFSERKHKTQIQRGERGLTSNARNQSQTRGWKKRSTTSVLFLVDRDYDNAVMSMNDKKEKENERGKNAKIKKKSEKKEQQRNCVASEFLGHSRLEFAPCIVQSNKLLEIGDLPHLELAPHTS